MFEYKTKTTYCLFFILTCLLSSCGMQKSKDAVQKEDRKPNVVFIAVDDLRPELGCYDSALALTPHMDKLANNGTLFLNHYAQAPTCGASRASMLTGTLPSRPRDISNSAVRQKISDQPKTKSPETFIEHFKNNGYHTVGIGKIGHSVDGYLYGYEDSVSEKMELPNSWDEIHFDSGKWKTGWKAFFGYANGESRQSLKSQVKPYEKAAVADTGYADGLTAELAVKNLAELATKKEPFFLGVGFFKPHLPFTAPKKYWDLYKEEEISLSPASILPESVNAASLSQSEEFNQYLAGDEKPSLSKPVSDAYARKLRHAYFAAVSYVDAQVGKVLDELERLGIAENTIIVLWGDHGWQLGDHQIWGKHTLSEQSLRSAFIIKAPEYPKEQKTDCIVSAIDIYPTLLELCKLPVPQNVKLDGTSLTPLLAGKKLKNSDNVSYAYFNNGISMRTSSYRLTRYFRNEKPVVELYDHVKDPFENRNIASKNPDLVQKLMPLWEKGDTGIFDRFK